MEGVDEHGGFSPRARSFIYKVDGLEPGGSFEEGAIYIYYIYIIYIYGCGSWHRGTMVDHRK